VETLAQQLDKAGIAFTRSQSGRAALFCRDPDDNALEFVETGGLAKDGTASSPDRFALMLLCHRRVAA
jgi:hypothetical protein